MENADQGIRSIQHPQRDWRLCRPRRCFCVRAYTFDDRTLRSRFCAKHPHWHTLPEFQLPAPLDRQDHFCSVIRSLYHLDHRRRILISAPTQSLCCLDQTRIHDLGYCCPKLHLFPICLQPEAGYQVDRIRVLPQVSLHCGDLVHWW